MDNERKQVPMWQRFWEYPLILRGIPGAFTFWRGGIPWDALKAGGIVFGLLMFVRFKLGFGPSGMVMGFWWHLGLPCVVGYVVAKVRTRGKRIDSWLRSYLGYWRNPKVTDRYRGVDTRPTEYRYTERRRALWDDRRRNGK